MASVFNANTAINTLARERLSRLIEYCARGPLSNERIEIVENGNIKLKLKSKWLDGTTALLFTPGEFLERLAALVPPQRCHLVHWSGVFASASPYRKDITLRPQVRKGFQFCDDDGEEKISANSSWARMLAKVFKVDVTKCDGCGGKLTLICAVTNAASIRRYLQHVGFDHRPPQRAPPRWVQPMLDFDQTSSSGYNF